MSKLCSFSHSEQVWRATPAHDWLELYRPEGGRGWWCRALLRFASITQHPLCSMAHIISIGSRLLTRTQPGADRLKPGIKMFARASGSIVEARTAGSNAHAVCWQRWIPGTAAVQGLNDSCPLWHDARDMRGSGHTNMRSTMSFLTRLPTERPRFDRISCSSALPS